MRTLGLLALAVAAGTAHAGEIAVATDTGALVTVDSETRAVHAVAQTPQFFDIAADSAGRIWGVTGQGLLFRVTPATGAVDLIGTTRTFVNALAFDADDRLFGAGNAGLFWIDQTTGAAMPVARIPGFASSGDLAAAPGRLFATSMGPKGDVLFAIDPGSGQSRRVGPIGFGQVYGLAWTGGRLIGVTRDRQLIRIDTESGAGTLLGPLDLPGAGYGAAALRELVSG